MNAAFDFYQIVHGLYRKGVTSWDDVIEAWNEVGRFRGEWAGMPYPVASIPLVMAPRFNLQSRKRMKKAKSIIIRRNDWYSKRFDATIYIYESDDGKIWAEVDRHTWKTRFRLFDDTLLVAGVWSGRAEIEAMKTLKELISDEEYRRYVLTGCFVEESKRSNLLYFIRKLRPTIVVNPKGKILTTLCLHAQGYYSGTWAGAMVPTDDAITHLLYIRGDEKKFWGKANHHPPWSTLSGI